MLLMTIPAPVFLRLRSHSKPIWRVRIPFFTSFRRGEMIPFVALSATGTAKAAV
jgi:hypothetical protein